MTDRWRRAPRWPRRSRTTPDPAVEDRRRRRPRTPRRSPRGPAGRGDELIGDPYAAGTGATGTGTGAAPDNIRTGAEQPWEPEDLVRARGQDLTPENVERARRDLAELGRAAIERTVP